MMTAGALTKLVTGDRGVNEGGSQMVAHDQTETVTSWEVMVAMECDRGRGCGSCRRHRGRCC